MSGRFKIYMCHQPTNSCTKWTDVTLVDEPTATVMTKCSLPPSLTMMMMMMMIMMMMTHGAKDNRKALEMMRFGSLPCIQRSGHTFTHFGASHFNVDMHG